MVKVDYKKELEEIKPISDCAENILKLAGEDMTEADDLLFEVLYQACGYNEPNMRLDVIDNEFNSPYEDACVYLEKKGYLKKIDDRMYKVLER